MTPQKKLTPGKRTPGKRGPKPGAANAGRPKGPAKVRVVLSLTPATAAALGPRPSATVEAHFGARVTQPTESHN